MFDTSISFHVTYFPEDRRIVVGCLNDPQVPFIDVLGVFPYAHSVSQASAQAISSVLSDNRFQDFLEFYYPDSCSGDGDPLYAELEAERYREALEDEKEISSSLF